MMDEILETLLHTKNYTIEKLNKGYTNQNFLVSSKQKTLVLRVPYEDHKSLLHHNYEQEILPLVQVLDVPCLYFNKDTGIKITQYIEGCVEFKDYIGEDKIVRSAKLIKKLHSFPCIDHSFDPLRTLCEYKKKVKDPVYELKDYQFVLDEIATLDNQQVLCHNDIVSGNLLFSPTRDYLIDYEYACNNDPLFDVMSFLSENNITDHSQREQFYANYFEQITPNIRKQLTLWEAFHNILWCNWAMMLYESRGDTIYQTIASQKYHALQEMELID